MTEKILQELIKRLTLQIEDMQNMVFVYQGMLNELQSEECDSCKVDLT